jgi:hypothetical protein
MFAHVARDAEMNLRGRLVSFFFLFLFSFICAHRARDAEMQHGGGGGLVSYFLLHAQSNLGTGCIINLFLWRNGEISQKNSKYAVP